MPNGISNLFDLEAAVVQFDDAFDYHTYHDLGRHMTCREADGLAALLRADIDLAPYIAAIDKAKA